MIKRILITPGEPAGIGPDITLQAVQEDWAAELVVVADPELLIERAALLNLPLSLLEIDFNLPPTPHLPGTLKIAPISTKAPVKPGLLNANNADYVLRTLHFAATCCQKQQADAIVTGPVHKGTINQAGISFTGHTEFFADFCGAPQTVMLFIVNEMKVALLTTHLALANVPAAVTNTLLHQTLSTLRQSLQREFHIAAPRILVCGLNPHAGENGYLGREEIDIITPALDELRAQEFHLEGPLPADTIFTPGPLARADAILAMYHDQALPLVKYAGFGHAVNMTLGLPFIRTSVDHGTALNVAGTKQADPGSLFAALALAIRL